MRYETAKSGRRGQPDSATDTLARGLGVFSIALGLVEILAARALTKHLGMRGHETLMRAYGMREIATGIGVLATNDPTPWIWGRVAGDVLDLGTLGAYYEDENPHQGNVLTALVSVVGVTALDVYCAQQLSRESPHPLPPPRDYSGRRGMPRPPEEMRGAASDFEIPRDMRTPEALRPYTRP